MSARALSARTARTRGEAAAAIEPLSQRLRREVYEAISGAGAQGRTDEEIERVTGLKGSTVRPRRVELVTLGLIKDSGFLRRSRGGRNCVVWMAKR